MSDFLDICNKRYKEKQEEKFPSAPMELISKQIDSDQIKVVIEVFEKEIKSLKQEISDLWNKLLI